VHGLVQRGALLQSNEEHREIVNALKSGNASLGYDTSFSHVSKGKERVLLSLDELAKSGAGAGSDRREVADRSA
jgi:DNA-binding GntR family transcriptional regulator